MELPELLIIFALVAGALLQVWPPARICRRIGFSSWLGFFAAVPIANIALLWLVAFLPWPASPGGERGA